MQDKPTKFLASLYGGLVIATIWTIPGINLINCFCCAGIILGGIVSVFLYSQQLTPEMPRLTAGDGMLLGGGAGVVGAFMSLLLQLVVYALFGNLAEQIAYDIFRWILQYSDIPSETVELVEQIFRDALERGLTPLVLFFQLMQNLLLFTLFGLLGGLLGYAFFKNKGKQIQPSTPAP